MKTADKWKLSPYTNEDGDRGCNEYVEKDFSSESSMNGFCEYILSSPYILNRITGIIKHDFRKNVFFLETTSHEFERNDDYLIRCTDDYSNNTIIISLNGKELYSKYKKTCRSWAQARKYIIDLINMLEDMKKTDNNMTANIKVAKQLIKLAKSLVSYQDDKTITQKSVHEQIMQEDNVSEIDKLIKENYPNKYEDVTEDEWMHIFDICQGFAYDQVIREQSMNTHDVNDVMNIFRSKIWNKIEKKDFKTYKGEDIKNLQQYLFGAIKFIAKKYKEAFYLHRRDKRDISIEENELQNFINDNSFEEPEKIEQENQYNEAINVMLEEVEKLKDYKINDFKKHAPIQNEDFSFFDLLKMYFWEKIPMETIAKELGIKYSGVQQLLKHIFPILKNKLQQKGIKNLNNIDIIKTSSDFIEDLLNDEKLWQMIK